MAFLGASLPVSADQNDPKLDGLFKRLLAAKNVEIAAQIETDIWAIWVHRGDARIDRHMGLGIRAMHAGAFHLSLREFSKVIELDSDFAEGWNKRATVHYMMGNLEKSAMDIEHTLALEPRHYGAISGMGLIFEKTDNISGALKAWQHVLKFTPLNQTVQKRVQELKRQLLGKPI